MSAEELLEADMIARATAESLRLAAQSSHSSTSLSTSSSAGSAAASTQQSLQSAASPPPLSASKSPLSGGSHTAVSHTVRPLKNRKDSKTTTTSTGTINSDNDVDFAVESPASSAPFAHPSDAWAATSPDAVRTYPPLL